MSDDVTDRLRANGGPLALTAAGEIDAVFVGPNYVVSVRNRSAQGFLGVRTRCESEPHLLRQGAQLGIGDLAIGQLLGAERRQAQLSHRLGITPAPVGPARVAVGRAADEADVPVTLAVQVVHQRGGGCQEGKEGETAHENGAYQRIRVAP